ncbi:hypothetical protein V5J96_001301 [Enterobacter cloacae]
MALELKDLIPLGNSLIGVFGVLAGGALTHFFNERRVAKQAALDEKKENKKLILQKGEELHQLLNEWKKYVTIVNMMYHKILIGRAQLEELNAYNSECKDIGRSHDRLVTLLSMHFPDLLKQMESISEKIAVCNNIFHESFTSQNEPDLEKFIYNGRLLENELDEMQEALIGKTKLPIS